MSGRGVVASRVGKHHDREEGREKDEGDPNRANRAAGGAYIHFRKKYILLCCVYYSIVEGTTTSKNEPSVLILNSLPCAMHTIDQTHVYVAGMRRVFEGARNQGGRLTGR